MKCFLPILITFTVASAAQAETPLESALLAAVRDAHFEGVVDFGAGNRDHPVKAHLNVPAPKIAHPPNLDVAVIELDAAGNMVDRADVLLSRDYPNGLVVPLDRDAGAKSVRFLRWDIQRSDGGTFSSEDGHQLSTKGWTNDPPLSENDDLVPGRSGAPIQFLAPYPASLFKLMVVFHLMRMVDSGKITLGTDYTYAIAGAESGSGKSETFRLIAAPLVDHQTRLLESWKKETSPKLQAEIRVLDKEIASLEKKAAKTPESMERDRMVAELQFKLARKGDLTRRAVMPCIVAQDVTTERLAVLLRELNLLLEQLRVLWRLVQQRQWISQQQLLFANGRLDEIGRMTGGWLNSLAREK